MMTDKADVALDALGDPTRRRILELLADRPRSITGLSDLLPVSRPAVSKHLTRLRAAKLVDCRVDGTRHVYALHEHGFMTIRAYLDGFWPDALRRFRTVAENLTGDDEAAP